MKRALLLLFVCLFISQSQAYDKLSLVERFTNASCAPCAALNSAWYNATTQNLINSGSISHIVYNVNWPGPNDPMYLLNSADNMARRTYYAVSWVPWPLVNGVYFDYQTMGQTQFVNTVNSGNSQFAPFEIIITQEALSDNLIQVGIKITRDPNDVTVFGNPKLRVALTEKTVSFSTPPGSNGEKDFFSVCRKMLPDANGSTFTIPAPGESVELSLQYVPTTAFLQAVNLDSLRIVAFIQDDPSKVLYQSEMLEVVPDYVATINAISSDAIIDNNLPVEFTTAIYNQGFKNDTYNITANFEGPAGWTGEFTTVNGSFSFGEIDSVQVAIGDSTIVSVMINPNGYNGSGKVTVEFESKNNPGMGGSAILRIVTIYGTDILVVEASENSAADYVFNSIENVFPGKASIVSRTALNPSTVLDNFQMITWSAGNTLPAFYPEEVDAIQNYLDDGGKLFINGQDIGEDVFGAGGQSQFAQGFYNNYLHASYTGAGNIYLIKPVPGDPITNGIEFVLINPPLPYPDKIAPFDSYASSIFTYMNGPDVAGIKAAANDYKVVYFSFCFEHVPDSDDRDTLISRMINYFDVEPMQLPSTPVLVSPANSGIIDSSSVLFVWQQSQPQVSKYWIELDTTDQFTSPFVNSDINDTTYLFTGLLPNMNYWWRVKALNSAGWGDYSEVRTFSTLFVGMDDGESQIPTKFNLEQNYPNPFNPATTIAYSIPKESQVSLKIYDVMGREVVEVVNGRQSAGSYNVEFDASSLASGTYLYKLTAGEFISVKKMVLLK